MSFWPFGRIKAGDPVVLVDHSSWTVNRHLIGLETVVVGCPGESPLMLPGKELRWPQSTYLVECDSKPYGLLFVTVPCVRKRRGDKDPNTASSWSRSVWKPNKQRESA